MDRLPSAFSLNTLQRVMLLFRLEVGDWSRVTRKIKNARDKAAGRAHDNDDDDDDDEKSSDDDGYSLPSLMDGIDDYDVDDVDDVNDVDDVDEGDVLDAYGFADLVSSDQDEEQLGDLPHADPPSAATAPPPIAKAATNRIRFTDVLSLDDRFVEYA